MNLELNLQKNNTQPYFSPGTIQLYHIVEDLLRQSGKADLFISSFTVAEEFVRKLNKLKDQDLVQHMQLLIDSRSAKKTLHLSWFLFSVADEVYIGNNHSKVILIENDKWKISVVTSQNQTRGNRIEVGLICTQPHIFDELKSKFDTELTKCFKLSDVLGRPTE